MQKPDNEIDVDKSCEEMADATQGAEAAKKARQRAQEIAARRQAINYDYIVKMEIDGANPTSIALFMSTGKVWRIEKQSLDGDNSGMAPTSLYELYDELTKKGSGLFKIPAGFRLLGN